MLHEFFEMTEFDFSVFGLSGSHLYRFGGEKASSVHLYHRQCIVALTPGNPQSGGITAVTGSWLSRGLRGSVMECSTLIPHGDQSPVISSRQNLPDCLRTHIFPAFLIPCADLDSENL